MTATRKPYVPEKRTDVPKAWRTNPAAWWAHVRNCADFSTYYEEPRS